MKSQRWILIAAVVLAVGYVWLRGGFVGFGSTLPARARRHRRRPRPTRPPHRTCVERPRRSRTGSRGRYSPPGASGAPKPISTRCLASCPRRPVTPAARCPIPTTRACRAAGPATPRRSRSSTTRPWSPTTSCSITTGRTSIRSPRTGSSATSARSTVRRFSCSTTTQRAAAEASKARIQQRFKDTAVVVAISGAGVFYPAEEYHQDYYRKNSAQYGSTDTAVVAMRDCRPSGARGNKATGLRIQGSGPRAVSGRQAWGLGQP